MKKIQILSTDLINKIAAGEVVERPASVVKELVENAIDADAKQITVEIEQGGIEFIKVKDDGVGMDESNAKLALLQHSTSKIITENDLHNIVTLGFRGEALASIASISDTTIHTYDGSTSPFEVKSVNSQIVSELGSGRTRGTTITVRNIFKYVPARRKFLRSVQTEYKNILDIFINLALSHPQIGLTLIHNKRTALQLEIGDLKKRIEQIFPSFQNSLIPINYSGNDLAISGFLGHPKLARKDNDNQFIFLNSRPIKDSLLRKAVKDGYSTSIMHGLYPVFFLNIKIDPGQVDVNIHPRKLEVKFIYPGKIFSILRSNIEKSINLEMQSEFRTKLARNDNQPVSSFRGSLQATESYQSRPRNFGYAKNSTNQSLAFTKELLQNKLPTNNFDVSNLGKFLQVFLTYIILEREDTIVVIDQHAADERINYEKLRNIFEKGEYISSQQLLLPEELSLTPIEKELMNKYHSNLIQFGFIIQEYSSHSWQIVEIPLLLIKSDYHATIKNILHELDETSGKGVDAITNASDKILSTLACHGSIRAGQKLHDAEISKLVNDLFKCKLPYSCPHGRPFSWEISRNDIEKQFKRKI